VQEDSKLRVADLEIDRATHQASCEGRRLDLKPKEFALLEFLMRNAHCPVTRIMIIKGVWDIHFQATSNVIDVHINSLRNKIDRGESRTLIHTIRGVGYMLTDTRP
jgi:two-component system OmpR family response regulator